MSAGREAKAHNVVVHRCISFAEIQEYVIAGFCFIGYASLPI